MLPFDNLKTGVLAAVVKEVACERTCFFYADEGLVAEYDAAGTELASYGYQPDSTWTTDPLWQKRNGEYYFYQNDHLGTPQKLVKQNGAVVWSASYTAFGQATLEVEEIMNNLRFPGQYADAETGLHYNFHRYYAPGIGRYLRVDPIGFAGGIDLYAYGLNNPVNTADSYGLMAGVAIAISACLASPPCAAAVAAAVVTTHYIICRAVGGCQPWPGPTLRRPPREECEPIPRIKVEPIPLPRKRRKLCSCICRAYCDERVKDNPCIGKTPYAFGEAVANTCSQAMKDAKSDARKNLGGQAKHQECVCIDSHGNVIRK